MMMMRQLVDRGVAVSSRNLITSFMRNMATKDKQSIQFDPVKGAAKSAKPEFDASKSEQAYIKKVVSEPGTPRHIKFLMWWKTDKGRTVCLGLGIIGSFVAASIPVIKNTSLLNFIREYYQHYSEGFPEKIPFEIKRSILVPVMIDLGLTKEQSEQKKFFSSTHPETCSWGDINSSAGAIIGYPFWFRFTSETEVPLHKFQYGRKGSEIVKSMSDSEKERAAGKNLANSLILSDGAKKFGVAREIIKVRDQPSFYYQGFMAGCGVTLYIALSKLINHKWILLRAPPLLRIANYVISFNMSLLIYVTSKDVHNRKVQALVDEQVSSLSKEYAEGGVEYYTKLMKRNAARRELVLGDDRRYNLKGEEIHEWIRKRNLSIKERLQICQSVLNKHEEI